MRLHCFHTQPKRHVARCVRFYTRVCFMVCVHVICLVPFVAINKCRTFLHLLNVWRTISTLTEIIGRAVTFRSWSNAVKVRQPGGCDVGTSFPMLSWIQSMWPLKPLLLVKLMHSRLEMTETTVWVHLQRWIESGSLVPHEYQINIVNKKLFLMFQLEK